MNFNNISDIDLLIYEIEFIFCFLVFFFIIQAKRELEKIEEEEILRMLRRKYEKGDK